MVSRADEFPSGVEAARDRLESEVSLLTHCTCYGVTPCEGSQLVYFAGLEPVDGEEVSSLRFAAMMIKGGEYARARLFDWPNHTYRIGEICGELMRDFQERPGWPGDWILPQSIQVTSAHPLSTAQGLNVRGIIPPVGKADRSCRLNAI